MSIFGKLIGAIAAPFTGGASLLGSLGGSAISSIGGLAGSYIDRKNAKADRDFQNDYNSPMQIRARAEAAGFNPLAFTQNIPSATLGGASVPVGQALADASLLIGDSLDKRRLENSRAAKLQQQNEELRKKLTQKTLRPKVGGIFGGGDVPHTSSIAPIRTLDGDLRPQRSPWASNSDLSFPVTKPNGDLHFISKGVASRLDLNPYDMWIGEDTEAVLGESPVTEAINAFNTPAGLTSVGRIVGMPTAKGIADAFLPLADNASDDPRRWSRAKQREAFGSVPDGIDEVNGQYFPYWNSGKKGAPSGARIKVK